MHENVLKIINLVDLKIRNKYDKTLKELLIENTLEDVINILCSDKEIVSMIDYYNAFEPFINYLKQIQFETQKKIIEKINDSDIEYSKGSKNFEAFYRRLSEEEIHKLFKALLNNYILYNKLYKDKIYKIETTLNQSALINIGKAKLFHLLGFNYENFRNNISSISKIIPSANSILNKNYREMVINDDEDLLNLLEEIIYNEGKIIKAIINKELPYTLFCSPKILTKNYCFERLGILSSPTGIVFNINKTGNLHSDIFLLRDIIRDYKLNWIFNGYAHNREISLSSGDIKNVKNAETILLTDDKSYRFNSQLVGISSSIGSINKSDFDYKVQEIPITSEFSMEEMVFMAQKIISNFPTLNLSHLKEFVNENSNFKRK